MTALLSHARACVEAVAGFVLLHLKPPPLRWNLPRLAWLGWQTTKLRNPAGLLSKGQITVDIFQKIGNLISLAEQNPWILSEGKDDALTLMAAASGDKAAVAADLKKDIDDLPIPQEWKALTEADVLVNAGADFLVAGVAQLKARLAPAPAVAPEDPSQPAA